MIRVHINDPDFTFDDMPTNWGAGVCRYKGELLEGILYDFFSNTNQLASESEYKEGIPNSKQIEYWQTGKLKVKCSKNMIIFMVLSNNGMNKVF